MEARRDLSGRSGAMASCPGMMWIFHKYLGQEKAGRAAIGWNRR